MSNALSIANGFLGLSMTFHELANNPRPLTDDERQQLRFPTGPFWEELSREKRPPMEYLYKGLMVFALEDVKTLKKFEEEFGAPLQEIIEQVLTRLDKPESYDEGLSKSLDQLSQLFLEASKEAAGQRCDSVPTSQH